MQGPWAFNHAEQQASDQPGANTQNRRVLQSQASRCQWDERGRDAAKSSRTSCYRVVSNVTALVLSDQPAQESALVVQTTTELLLQQLHADLSPSPVVSKNAGMPRLFVLIKTRVFTRTPLVGCVDGQRLDIGGTKAAVDQPVWMLDTSSLQLGVDMPAGNLIAPKTLQAKHHWHTEHTNALTQSNSASLLSCLPMPP